MEEAFVDLRIFRGPHAIVDVLVRDSSVFVSLPQFLRLAEVRTARSDIGSRVVSVIEPDGVRVVFDTDLNAVSRADSSFALPAASAVWNERALFVRTDVLARAYSVRVTVDWEDLVILVRGGEQLPAVRRLERVRRRAFVSAARSLSQPAHPLPVKRRLADGAVLDWAATTSTTDPLGTASLDLGFGAQVGGGSLELRHRQQSFAGHQVGTSEAAWTKAWSHGRWLRQLRVGDVFSTGRATRRLRGVTVTNAPFVRAPDFASEWFNTPLPEGWEVELRMRAEGARLTRRPG